MNLTCGPSLSVRQLVFSTRIILFPVNKIGPGFNLDRDCKVQGTNDSELKFEVHFAKPLQDLKHTFSFTYCKQQTWPNIN
jgi:hypothetical protein